MSNGDPPARSSVKVETSNAEGEGVQARAHNNSTSSPVVEVVEAEESTGDEDIEMNDADVTTIDHGGLSGSANKHNKVGYVHILQCKHTFRKPYALKIHNQV